MIAAVSVAADCSQPDVVPGVGQEVALKSLLISVFIG